MTNSNSHSKTHRVEFGETDAAGIVFYPNYFRWFDRATHDLFRHLGCPMTDLLRDGVVLPIIESKGRFTLPLVYGDEVVITSQISELRTRAFRIEHSVERDGQLSAEGYEVRVWTRHAQDGKLQAEPVPKHIRSRFAPAGD